MKLTKEVREGTIRKEIPNIATVTDLKLVRNHHELVGTEFYTSPINNIGIVEFDSNSATVTFPTTTNMQSSSDTAIIEMVQKLPPGKYIFLMSLVDGRCTPLYNITKKEVLVKTVYEPPEGLSSYALMFSDGKPFRLYYNAELPDIIKAIKLFCRSYDNKNITFEGIKAKLVMLNERGDINAVPDSAVDAIFGYFKGSLKAPNFVEPTTEREKGFITLANAFMENMQKEEDRLEKISKDEDDFSDI